LKERCTRYAILLCPPAGGHEHSGIEGIG